VLCTACLLMNSVNIILNQICLLIQPEVVIQVASVKNNNLLYKINLYIPRNTRRWKLVS
jgi:hypothetical protein